MCEELTRVNGKEGGTYKLGGKVGQTSRPVHDRVQEQIGENEDPLKAAYLLASTSKCVETMNEPELKPLLDRSIELGQKLFHVNGSGHDTRLLELHARYLYELGSAACYKGYTHQVFEHLTNTPTTEIEAAVARPKTFDSVATEVKRQSRYILPVFTWGHIRSYLEGLMDDMTIPEAMRTDANRYLQNTHEDRFAQNNLVRRCYGNSDRIQPFIDAIPSIDNPRVTELEGIVQELKKFHCNGDYSNDQNF